MLISVFQNKVLHNYIIPIWYNIQQYSICVTVRAYYYYIDFITGAVVVVSYFL